MLASACGESISGTAQSGGTSSADPSANAGAAAVSMGGSSASTTGSPGSGAGGSSGIHIVAVAGSSGAAGAGTNGETAGDDGLPAAADCGTVVWGTPESDPGYRGIRGTMNGDAFSVDGSQVNAWVAYCAADGPGPTPGLAIYFPFDGMSFWFDGCGGKVTSPDDPDWHSLDGNLSAEVVQPTTTATGGIVFSTASGHFQLRGQAESGPITIDADVYVNTALDDPCVPRLD